MATAAIGGNVEGRVGDENTSYDKPEILNYDR
jgi:hypothetical protein